MALPAVTPLARRLGHWLDGLAANGFAGKLLGLFGALASGLSCLQFVAPHLPERVTPRQWPVLIAVTALVALVIAVLWALPRTSIQYTYRHQGTWTIRICRGDLFDAGVPVVVTADRRASIAPFDTGPQSLVATLVSRWFGGDHAELERSLGRSRPGAGLLPVGEILPFANGTRSGWLYCLTDPTSGQHTSLLDVVTGHQRLWDSLRPLNVPAVAVPVLGSGFARARLSLEGLLWTLLLSFHAASLDGGVTRTLHVCIRDTDFTPRLLAGAARQLRALGYVRE